jgi:hypothetical protein
MLATSSVLRAGLIGFALFLSSVADGADQPISGAKLILTRTASGREKLVFISRDPAFLFPAPGGRTIPRRRRAHRTAAATAPGAAFDLPPGVGTPGCRPPPSTATDSPTRTRRRCLASEARPPAQGSLLRVVGRGTGCRSGRDRSPGAASHDRLAPELRAVRRELHHHGHRGAVHRAERVGARGRGLHGAEPRRGRVRRRGAAAGSSATAATTPRVRSLSGGLRVRAVLRRRHRQSGERAVRRGGEERWPAR